MNTHIRYILASFLVFAYVACATAQSLRPRYVVLQNNFQKINPGAINHVEVSREVKNRLAMVSLQNQQQDIDGTNSINAQHLRIELVDANANAIFGGGITREEVHIHTTTQVAGNFGYIVDLDSRGSSTQNQRYLSLGLGGAANFISTDLERLRYADPTDVVLPISQTSYITVSGGAFYLYKDKKNPTLYAGISAYHNIGTERTPASTQFFGLIGMIFPTKNKALLLEPNAVLRYADYGSLLFGTTNASPVSIDAGLRAWYDNKGTFGFFGGAKVGTNDRLGLELGVSINAKRSKSTPSKLATSQRKKKNKLSSNAMRIGYTYDFQYRGEFKTTSISEIFLALPITLNRKPR